MKPAVVWQPAFGAWCREGAWHFRMWAPSARTLELVLTDETSRALTRDSEGVFTASWTDLRAGDTYMYRVDGDGPFPDIASRFQPDGVHGPSQLIDANAYQWRDQAWQPPTLRETVIYELHVGTFTPSGTFAEAAAALPRLASLGVTAIELMPVAAFAGSRNWGYDGVALFAPAACYGTPDDLRHLVDTAHAQGLAVILDVVYNHLGPDGAYHNQYADGFILTGGEWGGAIDLRDTDAAMMRAFCVDNALHWIHEYHIDGLRLDAVHAYRDLDTRSFARELTEAIRARSTRPVLIIGEDNRNDAALLRPAESGGIGLDAVWADDFHHHMRRLLAGDHEGYYRDYAGTTAAIAETIEQGWFFRGQWSEHHGRPRGTEPLGTRLEQFVFCLENHDQVGNRATGDRLHHTIDLAAWRAASALLLILPQTPLLFMGQEWAASTPFRYFTDHAGSLGEAVTEGRCREFAAFEAFTGPRERIPDPQTMATFADSRLLWDETLREPYACIWRLYRRLLAIRRELLVHAESVPAIVRARALDADTLLIERVLDDDRVLLGVVRLGGHGHVDFLPTFARCGGCARLWTVLCSTEERQYACHPQHLAWRPEGDRHIVEFERAGALLLIGARDVSG